MVVHTLSVEWMDACGKQTSCAEAAAWAKCTTPTNLKVSRTF